MTRTALKITICAAALMTASTAVQAADALNAGHYWTAAAQAQETLAPQTEQAPASIITASLDTTDEGAGFAVAQQGRIRIGY